ncbi:MAG: site-2 protease family protein, partial [Acidimicrobiales bacterium]
AVSVAIGVSALLVAAGAGFVGASALVVAGLSWLGLVNLTLAVFNMLPALPLDGGRALQAALWKRSGDREQATISAASVGRYIGWAIVAFGAWQFFGNGSGLWTMVIGWFILSGAKAEGLRARFLKRSRDWAPPRPSTGVLDGRPTSTWPGSAWPGTDWPGQAGPASGRPPVDVVDVDGHRVR